MKIYLVGGAVRDEILNLPIQERDWVVTGSSAEEMLAQGYSQVGKNFPVFLHPITHEEYALARKEKKTAKGYHGFICDFSPDVSLEEDLLRRDLTINAMAKDQNGHIIDPYHGLKDIQDKYLRHVSAAFIEDPVRVLRTARFYARYYHLGFKIADETLELMQKIVELGELQELSAERLAKEWLRAFTEKNPEKFIQVLRFCVALPSYLAKLKDEVLIQLSILTPNANIRLGLYLQDLTRQEILDFCQYLKLSKPLEKTILLYKQHKNSIKLQSAPEILACLEAFDALRQTDMFIQILNYYRVDQARQGQTIEVNIWLDIIHDCQKIKCPLAMQKNANITEIKQFFHQERIKTIQNRINKDVKR